MEKHYLNRTEPIPDTGTSSVVLDIEAWPEHPGMVRATITVILAHARRSEGVYLSDEPITEQEAETRAQAAAAEHRIGTIYVRGPADS